MFELAELADERRWPASTAQQLEAAERRFSAAVAKWDARAMCQASREIEELQAQLIEEVAADAA